MAGLVETNPTWYPTLNYIQEHYWFRHTLIPCFKWDSGAIRCPGKQWASFVHGFSNHQNFGMSHGDKIVSSPAIANPTNLAVDSRRVIDCQNRARRELSCRRKGKTYLLSPKLRCFSFLPLPSCIPVTLKDCTSFYNIASDFNRRIFAAATRTLCERGSTFLISNIPRLPNKSYCQLSTFLPESFFHV